MRGDLSVIGLQGTMKCRIAASATRYEVGEPLYLDGTTLGSGAASSNTAELMDADGVVLGTDTFRGVAINQPDPPYTGTLVAHLTKTAAPVAHIGIVRGRAETTANVDTTSEVIAITEDVTLIDYNSTGGTDGGELYTIKDTASADTSAFTIVDGNTATKHLDVTVDARAYRVGNDIS